MRGHFELALLLPLVGCFSASTGTGVQGDPGGCKGADCGHSSSSARVGGGSSRGSVSGSSGSSATSSVAGSTSSSGGTSGTGSGSGSSGTSSAAGGSSTGGQGSGNGDCQKPPYPDGGGCANGAFVTQVVDLVTCAPIANATVQALDETGVPISGAVLTATDGTFALCGAPGSAFTPFLQATGYPEWYAPEVQAGTYQYFAATLQLISNTLVSAMNSLTPGGLDPSQGGIVIGEVFGGLNCPGQSGAVLTLTYADGGAIPDGGYRQVYLSSSDFPDPSLTATSTPGIAAFYDFTIPTTGYFSMTASNANSACAPVANEELGFTGRVYVTSNAASLYPFQLP